MAFSRRACIRALPRHGRSRNLDRKQLFFCICTHRHHHARSHQGLAVAAAATVALYGYRAYVQRRGIVVDPSRNVANADVPRPARGDMYDLATVDTFPPGECAVEAARG